MTKEVEKNGIYDDTCKAESRKHCYWYIEKVQNPNSTVQKTVENSNSTKSTWLMVCNSLKNYVWQVRIKIKFILVWNHASTTMKPIVISIDLSLLPQKGQWSLM